MIEISESEARELGVKVEYIGAAALGEAHDLRLAIIMIGVSRASGIPLASARRGGSGPDSEKDRLSLS